MRFVEKDGHYYLTHIAPDEIRIRNLAAIRTEKMTFDPKPEWLLNLKTPELVEQIAAIGVPVYEVVNEETSETSYWFKLRAYPKIYENRDGSQTHWPKVIIKTSDSEKRLQVDEFREADRTIPKAVFIKFHTWVDNVKYPNMKVAATIDELVVVADEEAGIRSEDDYIGTLLASMDENAYDEEPLPFV